MVHRPASPLSPNQRAASRNGSISRTSAKDRGGRPARATTPRTTTASATVLAAASLDRRPGRARPARPVSTATAAGRPRRAPARGMTIVAVEAALRRAVAGAADDQQRHGDEPDLAERPLGDRPAAVAPVVAGGPAVVRGQAAPLHDRPSRRCAVRRCAATLCAASRSSTSAVQVLRQQAPTRGSAPVGAAPARSGRAAPRRGSPAARRPTGRRPGRRTGARGPARPAARRRSPPAAGCGPRRATATGRPTHGTARTAAPWICSTCRNSLSGTALASPWVRKVPSGSCSTMRCSTRRCRRPARRGPRCSASAPRG